MRCVIFVLKLIATQFFYKFSIYSLGGGSGNRIKVDHPFFLYNCRSSHQSFHIIVGHTYLLLQYILFRHNRRFDSYLFFLGRFILHRMAE